MAVYGGQFTFTNGEESREEIFINFSENFKNKLDEFIISELRDQAKEKNITAKEAMIGILLGMVFVSKKVRSVYKETFDEEMVKIEEVLEFFNK